MEEGGAVDRNWLLVLDGLPEPVSHARDFTRRALAAWHWLPAATPEGRQAAEDVLLLVSEVVANACRHGGGPGALVLDCTDDRLRIEVTDTDPAPPVPPGSGAGPGSGRRRAAGGPGGYGLLIVDRLARAWGWRPGAAGKCVWLEVPCPPRAGVGGGVRHDAGTAAAGPGGTAPGGRPGDVRAEAVQT
ncbi:ATP-binding protein [Streptomyces sp. NPDC006670]|uniref:ATP-binding protein n=1 Tax=Streptomyces sp. NPDC006670 TaxID=3154476 RepID=UPI0033C19F32